MSNSFHIVPWPAAFVGCNLGKGAMFVERPRIDSPVLYSYNIGREAFIVGDEPTNANGLFASTERSGWAAERHEALDAIAALRAASKRGA